MRNPRTITAVTRRALCLALVVLCLGAWLAPVANAQVVDAVDAVVDTVTGGDGTASEPDPSSTPASGSTDPSSPDSGESDSSTPADSGSTDSTAEDTGSTDTSLVGNVVDSLEGDSKAESSDDDDPLKEVIKAINETAGETGLGEVVGGTVGAVDHAASQLTGSNGTVRQVTKALTGNGGRDKKSSSAGGTGYPTLEVLGQTFANANLFNAGGSHEVFVTSPRTVPAETPAAGESVISQIGRVAADALQKAAFPIALMLIVGAFLMVQNRIDRKDPKLALAPVDSEHDLLIFN